MTSTITSLAAQIEERTREIKADGYGMSIGEMRSLYLSGDIEIHPTFQRFFRWTAQQKSNLIESLLLGIPVPPIFVAQRQDGVWDVVDGVQRLSTILQFLGVLKNEAGLPVVPEPLIAAEYLTATEGVVFDDAAAAAAGVDPAQALDDVLRRDILRAKIDFRIIQKSSDPQAKFDLFQRLNSGTRLSEQESRNSLAVMLNPEFYAWLDALSREDSFRDTVLLSENKIASQYATELVVRYLAGVYRPKDELASMRDISTFLDDTVRRLAQDENFDRDEARARFIKTFEFLDKATGDSSFRRWTGSVHNGGFILGAYEVIAIGLAPNVEKWSIDSDTDRKTARDITRGVWTNDVFKSKSGSGRTGSTRMPPLVQLGADLFKR